MKFDIISLFPESMSAYLDASILGRAQKEGLLEVDLHQLRDYATDKHQTVDDTPYGGGAGMVLKVEPLVACLEAVLAMETVPREKTLVAVTGAKGERFTQKQARSIAKKYERIVFVCGRYEGIDERFIEHFCDVEFSIGEYVLTGGELPSLVMIDAIARMVPGVLGNSESGEYESYEEGMLEHPHYTKPESFRGMQVPGVLVSGHHGEIEKWRKQQQKPYGAETEE